MNTETLRASIKMNEKLTAQLREASKLLSAHGAATYAIGCLDIEAAKFETGTAHMRCELAHLEAREAQHAAAIDASGDDPRSTQ